VAEAFHSDAYLFGQTACVSPRAIFCIGTAEDAVDARVAFTAPELMPIRSQGARS